MAHTQSSLIWKVWSSLLHLYFRASRGLTIGVRAVVRSSDGKFLLVRHTYTPGWHFPGGGVESGQTIEEALAKELQQETGLLLIDTPKLHGVFFNRQVSNRDHVLVYLCEARGEISVGSPSPEIAKVGFFDLNELPDNIDRGTKQRLEEITKEQQISREW